MEWLSTMAEAYGKRAECFVNQFNNYPIDKVSNKKIKVRYLSYVNQLFFISYFLFQRVTELSLKF